MSVLIEVICGLVLIRSIGIVTRISIVIGPNLRIAGCGWIILAMNSLNRRQSDKRVSSTLLGVVLLLTTIILIHRTTSVKSSIGIVVDSLRRGRLLLTNIKLLLVLPSASGFEFRHFRQLVNVVLIVFWAEQQTASRWFLLLRNKLVRICCRVRSKWQVLLHILI